MKQSLLPSPLVKLSVLVIILALLTGCGSPAADPPSEGVQQEDTSVESSPEDSQSDMQNNSTGVEFEGEELPENFPDVFPLPEYAKVGSAVNMPGENSFRIFFAFPEVSLDEVLAFFHQELPANGWVIENENTGAPGMILEIARTEYEGKLDFIEDEYGIVLDLTLVPAGELEEIPGSAEDFGESEGLGESGGVFPADFPVPSRFTAIDLPTKLADEGYQLAFNFPDLAELAIIEISTGLMSDEWEIGDFEVGANGGYYILPFTSSATGFQGYALITAKPEVAGLDSVSGSVIALHPGAAP